MSLAEVNPLLDWPEARALEDGKPKKLPSVEYVMTRVFGPQPTAADPASDKPDSPRDYDVAFRALKHGAELLEDLEARYRRLQSELVKAEERRRTDIEAAANELARWQQVLTDLIGRWEHSEAQLFEARALATAHSDRADLQDQRARAAELRLVEFEKIATGFHDQIVTAFGIKDRSLP